MDGLQGDGFLKEMGNAANAVLNVCKNAFSFQVPRWFTTLTTSAADGGMRLINNFRPVMPLNSRTVKTNMA